MAYQHGVYTNEIPSDVRAILPAESSLPFVVGTAPIGQLDDPSSSVNKPILINDWGEFVENFGDESAPKEGQFAHTLAEVAHYLFRIAGTGPAVFVNVLGEDPSHTVTGEAETLPVKDLVASADSISGIIKNSVVVKDQSASKTYVLGEDYELAYKGDVLQILVVPGGEIDSDGESQLTLEFDKYDVSAVSATDVIGGEDGSGKKTGIELIEDVYPTIRKTAAFLMVPKFDKDLSVVSIMRGKTRDINGNFDAMAVVNSYEEDRSDAIVWKTQNGLLDENMVITWPYGTLAGVVYHMSTIFVASCGAVDSQNEGVPSQSPSNRPVQLDGAVASDGSGGLNVVTQDQVRANQLNEQGITTAINQPHGWVVWGNETSAFPGTTDVKDRFIPVRRMVLWVKNSVNINNQVHLDWPLNRRQIDLVVGNVDIWLNSMTPDDLLPSPSVEFREQDNPQTKLLGGIAKFQIKISPPVPMQAIVFTIQYDASALSSLFEEG